MAYSTPLTAVSNSPLTAAQWNASVRDNMLVTPAALASATGRIFVATGANAIAERAISSAVVATLNTTASATFANLATPGPVVAVTTGANAIAIASSRISNSTASVFTAFGVTVTGASSIPASDPEALLDFGGGGRYTLVNHFAGTLTPGSNTFTMQYRASSGLGSFLDRKLTVIAL